MPLQDFKDKFTKQEKALKEGVKYFEMIFIDGKNTREEVFQSKIYLIIEKPGKKSRRQKPLHKLLFTPHGVTATYKWGEVETTEILFADCYDELDVNMKGDSLRVSFQKKGRLSQRTVLEFLSSENPRLIQFLTEVAILKHWVPLLEKGRNALLLSDGKAVIHERLKFS